MPRDVREIGNAILDTADHRKFDLTNMALNKIIYFSHGWFLAQYSEPLVDSNFEAWQFGPVHPQVYRQLKRFKDLPIRVRLTRIDLETGVDVPFEVRLPDRERDLVERITSFYGRHSAARLVQISHQPGAPWDQVWTSAENAPSPGMIIPDEITESFYRSRLSKPS